jgi:hypothetical protein
VHINGYGDWRQHKEKISIINIVRTYGAFHTSIKIFERTNTSKMIPVEHILITDLIVKNQ